MDLTDEVLEGMTEEETAAKKAVADEIELSETDNEVENFDEETQKTESEEQSEVFEAEELEAAENQLHTEIVKLEELEDRLKRNMAEFDNFRKRSEKEKSAMFALGAKHIVEALLPAIDNFEIGLKTIPEDTEAKAFYEGIVMIYNQLLKSLEDVGVKPIEALGKEFDPNFHNAVSHVEDEKFGENIVIEEYQKGYMYKDLIIRHTMVKVAN